MLLVIKHIVLVLLLIWGVLEIPWMCVGGPQRFVARWVLRLNGFCLKHKEQRSMALRRGYIGAKYHQCTSCAREQSARIVRRREATAEQVRKAKEVMGWDA